MFFGAVMVFLLVSSSHTNAQSVSQGDYDVDDDRLIEVSNLEQLDAVRYDLDGDGVPESGGDEAAYLLAFPGANARMGCPADGCEGYELTSDLDFNDPSSYTSGSVDQGWSRGGGGEGWLPIGIHSERFASTFDGNDYTIANLFIDRDTDYVGLFGGISSAGSIQQLGLVEAVVLGREYVGPLAGANGGTIINSNATGSTSGAGTVGGLVGTNDEPNGAIIDSYAACTVIGTSGLGGLAGGNFYTITGSHATGDVSGTNTVGGLAGWNSGPIRNSYATGNVWGTNTVGGLVGDNNSRGMITSSYATGNVLGGDGGSKIGGIVGVNYETIRGSYATGRVLGGSTVGGLVGGNFARGTTISSYAVGSVSGGYWVGGLVGRNGDAGVVMGSYATGGVVGNSSVGGLVGQNERPKGVSFSYWNIQTSGQAQGVGEGSTSGAEGKTTAELRAPTTYAGIYRNWNTDIDDADGDGLETTGADDPWDFGTADQYPALRADFDGDGEATWDEFGPQHSADSPPPGWEPLLPPTIAIAPPSVYPETCTNGRVVENPQENPGLVGDCRILLEGRDTLAGRATLNWSTGIPISRWQGITIEGSPARVVELKLIFADISGQIPPRLGELSALKILSFHINYLTGGIPPELAGLSELRDLDFHGNPLGGTIPPELANLSNLEALDLNATGLTGAIPPGFSKLSNLEILDLGQNDLTGSIPAELAALPKLRWLQLPKNQLTGVIPPELGNLTHLEILSLSLNQLTGNIPPELGQLSNLSTLSLGSNGLIGQVPQELANLSNLAILNLGDNQLVGGIPAWLPSLSRMDSIFLHGNQLTGTIPIGLGDLSDLTLLYLHDNQLTGAISPALGRLSRLSDLKLENNKLTGSLPAELGNLSNLEVLDLGYNDLTGVIPRGLGNLNNLEFLVLENNQLTGTIPAELSGLANLRYLRLKGNFLTGLIPAELATLSRLVEFDSAGNDLTGCVPWQLATKPKLDFKHDGLPICAPPVDEGGSFSLGASQPLDDYSLTIVAVGDAAHGTVSLDGATINYEHDGSETTTDSFSYIATDGTNTVTTTVEVTVTPVNDPPSTTADTAGVDEGDTLHLEAPALLHNDTDAEEDILTITTVGNAANGKVSLDGTTVVYEHDGSETTADGFTYTVTDGMDTDTATVEVTITPVNDPPIAVPDTAAVNEGDTVTVEASALLDNDTDDEGDQLSLMAVGNAANGIVFLDGTTITYQHGGSETTTDTFIYVVSDGISTATATVEITVTPVNDAPIAVPDTAAVNEGDTVYVEASVLLSNDTDAEDNSLSITAVGDAVNGNVFLDGTTITYKHSGSETTIDSFIYVVTDGISTATATVEITVIPVNDPPIAVPDTALVNEGGTFSVEASALLGNDTDAEDNTLTITAVGDAVNGNVHLDGTTITYEHDGSETTIDTFIYTMSDGTDNATAMVTVTVNPVNDLPVVPLIAFALGVGVVVLAAFVTIRVRDSRKLVER